MPVVESIGTAAGAALAIGISDTESVPGPFEAAGSAAGIATAQAYSSSEGVGAAAGVATASGVGAALQSQSAGSAAGVATVAGFGQVVITRTAENPKRYFMRIVAKRDGANGISEFDLVREDISIYPGTTESPLLSGGSHGGSPVTIPIDEDHSDASRPGATRLVLLDIPQLTSQHSGPGFIVAAGGISAGWTGAILYEKQGSEYVQTAELGSRAAIGRATTKLNSGSVTVFNSSGRTYVFDDTNTVDVTLIDSVSELVSVSDADLYAGVNAAALGVNGRWELFAYGTVTQLAAKKFRLSHLLRGLKGTEWAVGLHKNGDTFVLLDSALRRVEDAFGDLNVQRKFRAVSVGAGFDTAGDQKFTNTGVSLKPLAPVYFRGEEDVDGNRILRCWRRSRLDGLAGRDGTDSPPLGETNEKLEWDILNSAGTTVLRTLTSLGEAVLYAAVQQTADFGSVPSSLRVKVYQISEAAGRGYAGEATISSFDAGAIPPELVNEKPYPVRCTVRRPTSGGFLVNLPVTEQVIFPAGLATSRGVVRTAPTAEAVFSIRKNDVEFATMTFEAGETVAVFDSAADASFDPEDDDILTVVAPAPHDATLENLGFTIRGERI